MLDNMKGYPNFEEKSTGKVPIDVQLKKRVERLYLTAARDVVTMMKQSMDFWLLRSTAIDEYSSRDWLVDRFFVVGDFLPFAEFRNFVDSANVGVFVCFRRRSASS